MNLKVANRLENVQEYYFSKKLQEIALLNAQGKNIINLGIGSPDMAPHPTVLNTLYHYASQTNTHSYQSYKGIPELRQAIANWYQKFYHIALDVHKEILPLIGSKEGIMHLCMTYINPGDAVLVPDPGYPTYSSVVQLAEGICKSYSLTAENHWEPDLEELEKMDLHNVKIMFVNYPNMPTGANATLALFEKLVAFGLKHQILIVNDNPYSFILNDNPLSILQIKDAKETAVELNSLSKSLNMAGWRVGMLCGNATVLDAVIRFKSNMDSGMFQPVQMAAVSALELNQQWYNELNMVYQKRKTVVENLLDQLGCTYDKKQQGLFVWAKISENYSDGYAMSDAILYHKNVFITPGGIFGKQGTKYIRISLCQTEDVLNKALSRILA